MNVDNPWTKINFHFLQRNNDVEDEAEQIFTPTHLDPKICLTERGTDMSMVQKYVAGVNL